MSGKFWATKPDDYLAPRVESEGFASKAPKTLMENFENTVQKYSELPAMKMKRKVNVSTDLLNLCVLFDSYWNINSLTSLIS